MNSSRIQQTATLGPPDSQRFAQYSHRICTVYSQRFAKDSHSIRSICKLTRNVFARIRTHSHTVTPDHIGSHL